MPSIFDIRAEMLGREYRTYQQRMIGVEVSIGESFVYERDMRDVEAGRVVFPDQLRLDWEPPVVAIGSSVLTLDNSLRVVHVE